MGRFLSQSRRPKRARAAILSWQDAFPQIETSPSALKAAMDLSADHGLSVWDAVILSAAAAPDVACFFLKICTKASLGAE
jgi:predicted nucleic acid-binding protein